MQMIEFVEGRPLRECQCCHSSKKVIEVYFRDDNGQGVCVALCDSCRDVLVNRLTKSVKPKIAVFSIHWYECGNCGTSVNPGDKFCRHCGKKVKWDDAE